MWIAGLRGAGLDGFAQLTFEPRFNLLPDVVGGCERLVGLSIRFTYSVLLDRTSSCCFLLSVELIESIGWMTLRLEMLGEKASSAHERPNRPIFD